MSDIKLKPGHPTKFFHPSLGHVDATKGINAQQAKVLEKEGRLAKGNTPTPKKEEK